MSRTVCVLLCAAAVLQPVGSMASAETTKSAAVSERARDCAARYNKAIHLEDTMAAMMRSLMPIMISQLETETGKTLDAADKAGMVEAMAESAGVMGPKLQEELVPAMLSTFSEDELCAMTAFYESPEGQGVITKMPAYTVAASGAMARFMPAFQADMATRICKRMGCDAAKLPAARAS